MVFVLRAQRLEGQRRGFLGLDSWVDGDWLSRRGGVCKGLLSQRIQKT